MLVDFSSVEEELPMDLILAGDALLPRPLLQLPLLLSADTEEERDLHAFFSFVVDDDDDGATSDDSLISLRFAGLLL